MSTIINNLNIAKNRKTIKKNINRNKKINKNYKKKEALN